MITSLRGRSGPFIASFARERTTPSPQLTDVGCSFTDSFPMFGAPRVVGLVLEVFVGAPLDSTGLDSQVFEGADRPRPYSNESTSAAIDASMMLAEAPTVLQLACSSRLSMSTRVTAPVPEFESRMRTL